MLNPPVSDSRSSSSLDDLSSQWQATTREFVHGVNRFIRLGLEGRPRGPADYPIDSRDSLAREVVAAIRQANLSGNTDKLREQFAYAYEPFLDLLREQGQELPLVLLLDDGRVIVQVGAACGEEKYMVIDGNQTMSLPEGILGIGRSPNRQYFAVAHQAGIEIHRGWEGPVVSVLRWPSGCEGIPSEFVDRYLEAVKPPVVSRLVPYNSGDRAILVSHDGIFVLAPGTATRLLPTHEQLVEVLESISQGRDTGEPLYWSLDMSHAALSPDNQLIATGDVEHHFVFDADSLQRVAQYAPLSQEPHYAAFSADGGTIAFNSCYLYNGQTLGVAAPVLSDMVPECKTGCQGERVLHDETRVYAAVSRGEEFIFGDAEGFLTAVDIHGNCRWQHFIGGVVFDIDVSRDGKQLVVATGAGFVSFLELETGTPDSFAIGTSTNYEWRRWLLWCGEPSPLMW